MPVADTSPESREVVVRIKRSEADGRLVYGEVYAPDRLDTYGEAMSAEDIVTMAHRFMRLDLDRVIDVKHDNKVIEAHPVESFIARPGDPDYAAGAWVLGVRIDDEAVCARVENGEINAFSFESLVVYEDVEVEVEHVRDRVGRTEAALSDPHTHAYFVEIGEDGQVVGGRTSPGPDGHVHPIRRASTTEPAGPDRHHHRYFL